MESSIFVVVEYNSETISETQDIKVYPNAYKNFKLAVTAVKAEYPDELDELDELDVQDLTVEQKRNKQALESFKNPSKVYIEKGISIKIYKLTIISNSSSGGVAIIC